MSKVLVSETNLTAIADAIRTKKGSEDTYKPGEMAAAINSITTGSGGEGLPEGALTITGDCSSRFANDGWNWFLENYGSQAECSKITNAECMFFYNTLSEIPLKLKGMSSNSGSRSTREMFYGCSNLVKAPNMVGYFYTKDFSSMFENCISLKTIPDLFFAYCRPANEDIRIYSMFRYCESLETLPKNLFKEEGYKPDGVQIYTPAITRYSNAEYMFGGCYKLKAITDFPPYGPEDYATYNILAYAFNGLWMASRFTFRNKPGDTMESHLSNCLLDLTNNFGFASISAYEILDSSKQVTDDATYEALKNDPDYWTSDKAYARYNHTSAVETINSLPRLKEGYTSTVKFRGECGAKTDGGAINTLTEEERAVATDRGWTVSLVQGVL